MQYRPASATAYGFYSQSEKRSLILMVIVSVSWSSFEIALEIVSASRCGKSSDCLIVSKMAFASVSTLVTKWHLL